MEHISLIYEINGKDIYNINWFENEGSLTLYTKKYESLWELILKVEEIEYSPSVH